MTHIPAGEVERRVLFAATLAQVEDIHALAWGLDDQEGLVASGLLRFYEAFRDDDAVAHGLAASLAVLTDDIDHPALPERASSGLELVHDLLAIEFGHREAREGFDGSVPPRSVSPHGDGWQVQLVDGSVLELATR